MPTPDEMAATMRANAAEKTGRTVEAWLTVIASTGLRKHGEIVKLLKSEHGVTHGFANLIAHDFLARGAEPTDPIADQYSGTKAHLRPAYEAVIDAVGGFGDDVQLAPKKSYVSLRRSKQFATVGPATASALEIGLNLKGHETTGRLLAGRGMVTHRVRIGSPAEVDDELVRWLRSAYDAA
jgi:predicted transport protein